MSTVLFIFVSGHDQFMVSMLAMLSYIVEIKIIWLMSNVRMYDPDVFNDIPFSIRVSYVLFGYFHII